MRRVAHFLTTNFYSVVFAEQPACYIDSLSQTFIVNKVMLRWWPGNLPVTGDFDGRPNLSTFQLSEQSDPQWLDLPHLITRIHPGTPDQFSQMSTKRWISLQWWLLAQSRNISQLVSLRCNALFIIMQFSLLMCCNVLWNPDLFNQMWVDKRGLFF